MNHRAEMLADHVTRLRADLARLQARVVELEAAVRCAVEDLDLPDAEYSSLERRAIKLLPAALPDAGWAR